MDIKYFVNGDLTVGVGDYENSSLVTGVDDFIVYAIAGQCTANEADVLLDMHNTVAFAKPHGVDTFDEKVGRELVRDKLVKRDATRQLKKLAIINKYLSANLDDAIRSVGIMTNKRNNAIDRMNAHGWPEE